MHFADTESLDFSTAAEYRGLALRTRIWLGSAMGGKSGDEDKSAAYGRAYPLPCARIMRNVDSGIS
jgi:hypothetical protein